MRYLLTILLFLSLTATAQVNLVRNPSFEEYSACPDNFDQITYSNYWSAVDSDGINSCVPEFCHTCGTTVQGSLPYNSYFYQHPHSGDGLAHMAVFYDEVDTFWFRRDYLQGRLRETLVAGQSYCVSFYVTVAEMSEYGIDKIGAYLDDGSIDTVTNCSYPLTAYDPQVENSLGIISDTMNWVKIEGSFTANGTERFITIGNFYDLANTQYTVIPENMWNGSNDNWGYYLVDDVSVFPSDLQAFAGNDTGSYNVSDSFFLGRDEVGLDCQWYLNGNLIDSGSGIWVHPSSIDTYVVKQTLCGVVTWDTVVVWLADNVPHVNAQHIQLKLSPNPVSTQLTITANTDIKQVNVYDVTGREVLSSTENILDVSGLVSGVYFVRMWDVNGNIVTRKLLKE